MLFDLGLGAITRGFSQVTTLVLAIVAARLLGRTEFGIYAIATALIVLLQTLMYSGIYHYIVKDRSEHQIEDACFWLNMVIGVAAAILVSLFAPVAHHFIESPIIPQVMYVLAPSLALAAIASWQEALVLRREQLTHFYKNCLVSEAVAFCVGLTLLLTGAGLWSFVVYRYVQLLVSSAGYFFVLRRIPSLVWNPGVTVAALRYSWRLYASKVVENISTSAADLLIGAIASPAAAGAYRIGSRIVIGISTIAYQAATAMSWVRLSNVAHNRPKFRREWLQIVMIVSAITWPALAFMASQSGAIVRVVLGPGWEDVAPVITIIALARILSMFDFLIEPVLGVTGRGSLLLKLRTASATVAIISFALLARYGASGAAYAQLMTSIAGLTIALVVAQKSIEMSRADFLNALFPSLCTSAASLIGLECALRFAGPMPPILTLAIGGAGAGATFLMTASVVAMLQRKSGARLPV